MYNNIIILNQTRLCHLVLLLSAGLVCIKLASSREGISQVFYVTPTQPPNPKCPKNMSCQTLQYYVQKAATIRPMHSNESITLMFLSGNHTVPPCQCSRILYFSDYLSMVGLGRNIIIHNLHTEIYVYVAQLTIENVTFYNGQLILTGISAMDYKFIQHTDSIQLYIDSIQLIEYVLSINNAELGEIVRLQAHKSQVSITNSNNVTFTNCTFHDFDEIPIPYSILISIETAITLHQSHVTFSDNSKFYRNHNSALISYSSVITLAGSVSFFNNSSIRGGAMTLYSSTLNLASGANISFINNSAQETGGAIHVEPDITRMSKLECFYRTEHYCNNNNIVTLYFRNNSAKSGGDNVYGASLAYCQYYTSWNQNCPVIINSTLFDTRKSSVSSDPIYVCICNNEGQPQCTNSSFTNISKNVYPSEKFTLSVTIVGADYGMTIGNVYANLFLASIAGGAAPAVLASVLEQEYQYSQWIDNVSCKEFTYSIYTEYTVQHSVIMYFTAQYTDNPRYLADQNYRKYCSYSKCQKSPIYINVTILPCPLGFLKDPSTGR